MSAPTTDCPLEVFHLDRTVWVLVGSIIGVWVAASKAVTFLPLVSAPLIGPPLWVPDRTGHGRPALARQEAKPVCPSVGAGTST